MFAQVLYMIQNADWFVWCMFVEKPLRYWRHPIRPTWVATWPSDIPISDIKSWTAHTWEYNLPPKLHTNTDSSIKNILSWYCVFFTKGTFVWGYLNCCILPWTIVPNILITYLSTVEFTIISLRTKSPKSKVPHTLEL